MAQSQQQPPTMDADTMLDVYILDYLMKKNYGNSTKAFEGEAKVPANVRAIDAPRGFLFEWWTVFWDTFISRYKRHQGSMEPSNEVVRVPHQQQGGQHQSQSFNPNNVNLGKNPWIAEASTLMKQPVPPKQWFGDNTAFIMSHMNSIHQQPIEHQKQAMVPRHDINSLTNPMINPSAQLPEGIPTGPHGGINTMPLRGWPLTQHGLEQIQTRIHRQNEGQINPSNSMDRKRKQPMIPIGVPNTSLPPNAVGMFSNNSREVSKPNSPQNEKINVDDFIDYGAFDGNDNSLLPNADNEPQVNTSNDFTFLEVGSVEATSINCCHISYDGKLLAVGGQDKKARLWCTSTRENTATLEGHSHAITDIRFSPSMQLLATSSQDKTVRIWDLKNLSGPNPIRTFTGHTVSVLSTDFHPQKDLVCSCDESEIRFWTIKNAGCVKVTKGGANLVRFQSGVGKFLAAIVGKSISIMELENPQARKPALKGHGSNVQSLSWDSSGDYLVTVSEDVVKVWKMDSGGKGNCVHSLSVNGKRFRCATFHPEYSSLLVIGCYQSMELWNMAENKMMMPIEEPVSALSASSSSGLIASAGHNDNVIKIWK
ncbi:hypothetical protein LXL04_002605 [Taraxacum kok-saghyz]